MKRVTETFLVPWQAADYAGLKLEAMYELLESGEITGDKVDGRWRIRKSVLDAWLDAEVSPEELQKLTEKMRGLTPEQAQELLKQTQAAEIPLLFLETCVAPIQCCAQPLFGTNAVELCLFWRP